jgi:hypothetical protein
VPDAVTLESQLLDSEVVQAQPALVAIEKLLVAPAALMLALVGESA